MMVHARIGSNFWKGQLDGVEVDTFDLLLLGQLACASVVMRSSYGTGNFYDVEAFGIGNFFYVEAWGTVLR